MKDQSIKFYLNTKNHQQRLISTPILLNINKKVQTMPWKRTSKKLYENSAMTSSKTPSKSQNVSNCVNSFGQKVTISDFSLGKLLG
jgi:hypothetical protein